MFNGIILIVNSSSPEVTSDDLKKALAETDPTTAKQMVCDMGDFSEYHCNEAGSSSFIVKVMMGISKHISEIEDETITNTQVVNVKKGNFGIKGRSFNKILVKLNI